MIRKLIPWFFWIYISVLMAATVIPSWSTSEEAGIGMLKFRLDYWLHFLSYFGLGVSYIILKINQLSSSKKLLLFKKSYLLFLFGFLTEVIQIVIPGRNFSVLDFIADASGILLAVAICYILRTFIYRIINNELKPVKVRNSTEKEHKF